MIVSYCRCIDVLVKREYKRKKELYKYIGVEKKRRRMVS